MENGAEVCLKSTKTIAADVIFMSRKTILLHLAERNATRPERRTESRRDTIDADPAVGREIGDSYRVADGKSRDETLTDRGWCKLTNVLRISASTHGARVRDEETRTLTSSAIVCRDLLDVFLLFLPFSSV